MKKYWFIIFSFILGLVVIFYLYFRIGFGKIFQELSYLRWWKFGIILFISWFVFIFSNFRTRFLIQDLSCRKISLWSVVKARLAEAALSYFTPIVYTGGETLRLIILKKSDNVSFGNNTSALLVERLSELIALAIFLLTGGIFLFFTRENDLGLLFVVLSIVVIIIAVFALKIFGFKKLVLFFSKILKLDKIRYFSDSKGETSIAERLQTSLKESVLYIQKRKKRFFSAIIISLVVLLLWAWQLKLLLNFMGQNILLFKVYLIKILIIISGFAPVLARIGTFEAAYLAGFALFGLSGQSALACALVMRVMELTIIGTGIIVALRYLGDILFNIMKLFKRNNGNNFDYGKPKN